jgi:hypothetical protein
MSTEDFKDQMLEFAKWCLALIFFYAVFRYVCAAVRVSYAGAEYFQAAFVGELYRGTPWAEVTAKSLSDICAFCLLMSIVKGALQSMFGFRFFTIEYIFSIAYVLFFVSPAFLRIITGDFELFSEGFPAIFRSVLATLAMINAIVVPFFACKTIAIYFRQERTRKISAKNNSEN